LLASIRQIFAQSATDRISSRDLAAALAAWPGSDYQLSTPKLSTNALARLLSPLGLHHRTMRIGNRCIRGYKLSDFTKAFDRLATTVVG
jgi:hypothetical protein